MPIEKEDRFCNLFHDNTKLEVYNQWEVKAFKKKKKLLGGKLKLLVVKSILCFYP